MLVGIKSIHKKLVGFAIPQKGFDHERTGNISWHLEDVVKGLCFSGRNCWPVFGPFGCQMSGVMMDLPLSLMAIGHRIYDPASTGFSALSPPEWNNFLLFLSRRPSSIKTVTTFRGPVGKRCPAFLLVRTRSTCRRATTTRDSENKKFRPQDRNSAVAAHRT